MTNIFIRIKLDVSITDLLMNLAERGSIMNEKKFGKGEVIFREGDSGDSFFQITEGNVGIYANYQQEGQQKLTELGAGKYFGEMAVIETWPRSTTVVAEDDTSVIEITEDELNNYFKEHPDKIYALMKHLGSRIRALSDDYSEVNSLINELADADETKRYSLKDKIKKHLGFYKSSEKNLAKPSAEELRKAHATEDFGTSVLRVESYDKNTVIFKQGEKGDCMYAVHGGSVGIYSDYGTPNEKKLTELMSGTFFGEMGMIDHEVRSATAVTEEDCTIVEIIRENDLEALFESNPIEVDMLLRHMSHRLRLLTRDYLSACKLLDSNWKE